MDEPGWTWPAWKFGLKSDDLFTTLHAQYNTISSSIQDQEAFHHDVYEISQRASSAEEFHSLLSQRKQKRLMELTAALELASLEITADPTLIGTEKWEYAIHIFRDRSLDALVRYFSSYLPSCPADAPLSPPSDVESEPSDRQSFRSDTSKSDASTIATNMSDSDHVPPPFFDSEDSKQTPTLTQEPENIDQSPDVGHDDPVAVAASIQLPPSPCSFDVPDETKDLSQAVVDDDEADHICYSALTPARSLSFSGPESDQFFALDGLDPAKECSDAETPYAQEDSDHLVGATTHCANDDSVSVDGTNQTTRGNVLVVSTFGNGNDSDTRVRQASDDAQIIAQLSLSEVRRARNQHSRVPYDHHNADHVRRKSSPSTSPRLRQRELSPGRTIGKVCCSPTGSACKVQKPARSNQVLQRPGNTRRTEETLLQLELQGAAGVQCTYVC